MKNKAHLPLIFLTVFIDLLGFGILMPILPTFSTKVLHIDETAIGIAIAAYSFVQFLFNPFFGELSDKYGRKPIIVICLLLNSLGYIIFAFTNSYLLLILSRVIAGLGGSSIGVAQAYISDVTTKENRAKGMGMIGAAFGLGFVFGPLIGGFLANISYKITGLGSASFSFAAFLLTLILLPESRVKPVSPLASQGGKENGIIKKRRLIDVEGFKKVFKNPSLAILIIIFFILTFSIANIFGTFALLGYKIYHFNDLQNGYMYGILGLASALVQGLLIKFISVNISDKKIVSFGAFSMVVGLALMPFGGNFFGLAIIVVILSLGSGAMQPTLLSLVSKVVSEDEQGLTLGLNQSISAFGRVLGPLWGGFAFEYLGYQFPFLTGAFFALIIAIISLVYLPKHIHTHEQSEKLASS